MNERVFIFLLSFNVSSKSSGRTGKQQLLVYILKVTLGSVMCSCCNEPPHNVWGVCQRTPEQHRRPPILTSPLIRRLLPGNKHLLRSCWSLDQEVGLAPPHWGAGRFPEVSPEEMKSSGWRGHVITLFVSLRRPWAPNSLRDGNGLLRSSVTRDSDGGGVAAVRQHQPPCCPLVMSSRRHFLWLGGGGSGFSDAFRLTSPNQES